MHRETPPMMTLATGKRASSGVRGFTLVELLAVVAIMAIVMGVLGLSLRNMQGPSTQVAAAQVASGLSLARQIAISRNAETRFVVYGGQAGDAAVGVPRESWRYWTVIMTNKENPNPAANLWIMQKEWEKLPEGVVFLNIATAAYSTIEEDPIGATIGKAFRPLTSTNLGGSGKEWTGFSSYGTFNVAVATAPSSVAFSLVDAPVIGFKTTGEAVECKGSSRGTSMSSQQQAVGVRIADGISTDDGEIILRSINNYYYVETDRMGRIRVRAKESYR